MGVRKRRTADESRSIILQVAAKRLREQGLEGLNITGVAEEAGISHATLLHHFGSVAGMRDALADKMILSLVSDIVDALGARVPPTELTHNLFDTLAKGGHAKLLAWRAVENSKGFSDPQPVAELFNRLLEKTKEIVDVDTDADARQMIYLVACAAIGHGLAGNVLSGLLGMPDAEVDTFPRWMSTRLGAHSESSEETL